MTDKDKIISAFHKVKALGWVESHRSNNTGIGKTFEDYVGVVENNRKEPDLFGFEIKSHRANSASFITLFTKSPSHTDPTKDANAYLKDQFGATNSNGEKKLHTSIYAHRGNKCRKKYSFRLIHLPDEKRIYIAVYDLKNGNLLDKSVYYTYADIQEALSGKLSRLFYVTAQRKFHKGSEEFYFDSAEIYMDAPLDQFLSMVDAGEIRYDIRMGTYGSGKNMGKPHDHGSGFRIKESNLIKLYRLHEIVN